MKDSPKDENDRLSLGRSPLSATRTGTQLCYYVYPVMKLDSVEFLIRSIASMKPSLCLVLINPGLGTVSGRAYCSSRQVRSKVDVAQNSSAPCGNGGSMFSQLNLKGHLLIP